MSVGRVENPITIELPAEVLASIAETSEAFAKEMRLAAAIEWYREGRVSLGSGAELAGLNRSDFLDALVRAKVPAGRVETDLSNEEGNGTAEAGGGIERSEGKDREKSSTPTEEADAASPFTPEVAERNYQRLGRWKGPEASSEAQAEAKRFWRESDLPGTRWLVARLSEERHDDRLRGAAYTLADGGPASLGPILETLRGEPTADQALALLWALGWIGDRQKTEDVRAELVLVKYLFEKNPELREASARAMRLLPLQHAKPWLERRLCDESDREVRLTIEDELEVLQAAEVMLCTS